MQGQRITVDIDGKRGATVRVWDLPTRLFHWVLASAVLGAIVTAKIGGNAMQWHQRIGYLVFTLLAFRLIWGLVGGRWSRFSSFVRGPRTVWRHIRGAHGEQDRFVVGHNPLGAWSVLVMLAMLAVQVTTGLVADDEISTTGPLSKFVDSATALSATSWHKGLGGNVLIALIVLHVAAIVYYRVRWKADLVGPMVTGDKPLANGTLPSRDDALTRGAAAALLAACAALVAWVVSLGG